MGCIDAVLPEQLLRRSDVNWLVSNGYGETYNDYLCLFRAMAVHLYGSSELETNAKICLVHSSMNLDMTQSISEWYRSVVLYLLKMRESTTSSFMILTLKMEILQVNLQGEVLYSMRMHYVTTTIYAMGIISTHSLNNSVVPVAIRSFRKREISIAMLKRVKVEYSIFTQKVFIHCARNYLVNLTDLEVLSTRIKNCSKTWLFLSLNRHVYLPSN